jgi:hypothetical protein
LVLEAGQTGLRRVVENMRRNVSTALMRNLQTCTYKKIVYRVNWLRARARAQRWNEEKDIVMKEMEWVDWNFQLYG